ncbi:MAG: hypothetical protein AB4368_29970 [Xenococcaceae cyanobacterium]
MHTSKDEKALAPSVIVKIAPAYQKAKTAITQHYQETVAELEVKSEIFPQDLEEMTGGVR